MEETFMKNVLKLSCIALLATAGQVYSSQSAVARIHNVGLDGRHVYALIKGLTSVAAQNLMNHDGSGKELRKKGDNLFAVTAAGSFDEFREWRLSENLCKLVVDGLEDPIHRDLTESEVKYNQAWFDHAEDIQKRAKARVEAIAKTEVKYAKNAAKQMAKRQRKADSVRANLYANNQNTKFVQQWADSINDQRKELERAKDDQLTQLQQEAQDWDGYAKWPTAAEVRTRLVEAALSQRQQEITELNKKYNQSWVDYAKEVEAIESMNSSIQDYYDSLADVDAITKTPTSEVDVMKANLVLDLINGKCGNVGDFPEVRVAVALDERQQQIANLNDKYAQAWVDYVEQMKALHEADAVLTQRQLDEQAWEGCWDWPKDDSFDWKQFVKDNKEPLIVAGIVVAGGAGLYAGKKAQEQSVEA